MLKILSYIIIISFKMFRKSYTIEYKQKIIEDIKTSSIEQVCQKYSLDPKMVRRWKTNEFIQTAAKSETSRKRSYGAGRKILKMKFLIGLWKKEIRNWL